MMHLLVAAQRHRVKRSRSVSAAACRAPLLVHGTAKGIFMRWNLLILTVVGMLAGAAALPRGARAVAPTDSEPLARRLEMARLRAHFDSVDAELRHAKVLQFTSSQRRLRALLIGWLQEYRDAGKFPRNDRFPELAMPFFRDSYGALCAMAYLIERSGRRHLVDRIALTRNNAFIAELANDAELRVWLDSVGLSVTEAARIQPTYSFDTRVVETVVAQYDRAWNQRDTSTVNRLLAPEYKYSTSQGGMRSRADTLALLSAPDYRLEHTNRSEIAVSLSGSVAVVSSRWGADGTYRGHAFKDDQRCSQTWQQTSQTWQLLTEHCVQMTPPRHHATSAGSLASASNQRRLIQRIVTHWVHPPAAVHNSSGLAEFGRVGGPLFV